MMFRSREGKRGNGKLDEWPVSYPEKEKKKTRPVLPRRVFSLESMIVKDYIDDPFIRLQLQKLLEKHK